MNEREAIEEAFRTLRRAGWMARTSFRMSTQEGWHAAQMFAGPETPVCFFSECDDHKFDHRGQLHEQLGICHDGRDSHKNVPLSAKRAWEIVDALRQHRLRVVWNGDQENVVVISPGLLQ
jgi:hypothetical protein